MKHIESAGVVIYKNNTDKILYLLLQNVKGHWDFPKGKVDQGETKKEAALRETFEESGLRVNIQPGFGFLYSYDFIDFNGRDARKTVTFFLGDPESIQGQEVTLSHEHDNFGWFTLQQALEKLQFQEGKELLHDADQFIKKA